MIDKWDFVGLFSPDIALRTVILFFLLYQIFLPPKKIGWRGRPGSGRVKEKVRGLWENYKGRIEKMLSGTGTSFKKYTVRAGVIGLMGFLWGLFFYNSLLLGLVLALGFDYLHYLWYGLLSSGKKREYNEQLEMYMSLVTNSYLYTDSLLMSIGENISRFDKTKAAAIPFLTFYQLASYVNASQKECISMMARESGNLYFKQWCDKLILCQADARLKHVLPPLLTRMRQKRNLDGEMQALLAKDNSTFAAIVGLSSLLLFGIPAIQPDLRQALLCTGVGKALMIAAFGVIFWACGSVVKANKPAG